MKLFLICLFILGCYCSERIENASITDCGKIQIGVNLYLKKIEVEYPANIDKVYFLVNDRDEIISGASTIYSVGKTTETTSTIMK